MNHIMCPFDGSDPASRALQLAIVLAESLDARLTILIVSEYIVGRHDVMDVWSEPELKVILDHANDIIVKTGYANVSIVEERSRDAAFTVVDYAERNKVELVVIGASARIQSSASCLARFRTMSSARRIARSRSYIDPAHRALGAMPSMP